MERTGPQKHPINKFLSVLVKRLEHGLGNSDFSPSKRVSNKDQIRVGRRNWRSEPGSGRCDAPGTSHSNCFALLWYLPRAWLVAFLQLPAEPKIIIQKRGRYVATVQTEDANEEIIGEFYCEQVDPAPLTPEREAAIRSNPRAAKAARLVLGCQICPSKCRVYAALERMPSLEIEGFSWYRDIPEDFVCECGKTKFDLSTVKRNFFAVLGHSIGMSGQVDYKPFYERDAIENLRVEFTNLLDTDPPEESLQQFIEQNPILLHQFPAEKLFFKPPILTRFKADFAVVTSKA